MFTPLAVCLVCERLCSCYVPDQIAFQSFFNAPAKVLQSIICDGIRPEFPAHTPGWYKALASNCWHAAAKQRPSFRRIILQLQG